MTARKWHSGPPPSVGWWPASCMHKATVIRWWDGRRWSDCAPITSTPEVAARHAKNPAQTMGYSIQWAARWWL